MNYPFELVFNGKDGRTWEASATKPRSDLAMRDTETPYVIDVRVMFPDAAMAKQFLEDFKEATK